MNSQKQRPRRGQAERGVGTDPPARSRETLQPRGWRRQAVCLGQRLGPPLQGPQGAGLAMLTDVAGKGDRPSSISFRPGSWWRGRCLLPKDPCCPRVCPSVSLASIRSSLEAAAVCLVQNPDFPGTVSLLWFSPGSARIKGHPGTGWKHKCTHSTPDPSDLQLGRWGAAQDEF